jgi:putative addiction module component (TIGR02574 family)
MQRTYHFQQSLGAAMPDLVAELAERGRSLAPEERSRLVELLLESLHEPPLSEIEAAWEREIGARAAAFERGEVETFAAEDVFAEARRIAP